MTHGFDMIAPHPPAPPLVVVVMILSSKIDDDCCRVESIFDLLNKDQTAIFLA